MSGTQHRRRVRHGQFADADPIVDVEDPDGRTYLFCCEHCAQRALLTAAATFVCDGCAAVHRMEDCQMGCPHDGCSGTMTAVLS